MIKRGDLVTLIEGQSVVIVKPGKVYTVIDLMGTELLVVKEGDNIICSTQRKWRKVSITPIEDLM